MNTQRHIGLSRRQFIIAAGLAAAAAPGLAAEGGPSVSRSVFGKTPEGAEVELYTMSSGRGLEARVMTLGATLTTVSAPGRDGKSDIITLYLDTLEDYLRGHPLFGSVVGRYANRIANAKFTIDGVEHNVVPNAKPHHIHGGNKEAFHKVIWKAEPVRTADGAGVKLTHVSADGEAGFPGRVVAMVTYLVTADNRLIMDYSASTDKPTHVNLTNHAYWNLLGAGNGDVLGHVLQLNADKYLPADKAKIPTGEIAPVKGTVMDFTQPQAIGSRIEQVEGANYDHCYVINREKEGELVLAAKVVEPKTGRVMEVFTTQPGVQLYTARGVSNKTGAGGKTYGPYHGVCFETQHYPDAPNKPNFPSTLLRPGQTFHHTTVHKFSVQEAK